MPTPECYVIENLFRVANKTGEDVDFALNSAQRQIDENITDRDIIPKARQRGVSTYYLARNTVRCLHKRNTRAVVISHESDATQRMLQKVKYFLEHLKGDLKADVGSYSANTISFPKTNSVFYIGTAGSRKFGRGDTITDLHCSEVAFWENPKELTAGLFQAVPRAGYISIESTGKGVGNWYHQRVMRAAANMGRYKLHFLPWHEDEEYAVDLSLEDERKIMEDLRPEWRETYWEDDDGNLNPGVYEQFKLSPGQIAFRREKLEELDYDLHLLMQEYPMTLDECFQATGNSIFDRINFVHTDLWKRVDNHLSILEGHPIPGRVYIAGIDVGSGTGGGRTTDEGKVEGGCDNSVMEIFDLLTLEQVGEYITNNLEPDAFGHKANMLGRMFNNAFLTVESNNHGLTTIAALRDGKRGPGGELLVEAYPTYLMYRKPPGKGARPRSTVDLLATFGYNTNRKSKPFIIGKLRKYVQKMVTIHSPIMLTEMQSFIEHPDGSLGAEEGCKDDTVLAAALAIADVERSAMQLLPQKRAGNVQVYDPFALDTIIKEMRRSGSFLIPSNIL